MAFQKNKKTSKPKKNNTKILTVLPTKEDPFLHMAVNIALVAMMFAAVVMMTAVGVDMLLSNVDKITVTFDK